MKLCWTCRACGHSDSLKPTPNQEPGELAPPVLDIDALAAWSCPACNATGEARAFEDLASALDDALAQLAWVAQSIQLSIHIDSENIPEPYRPGLPLT